MRRIAITDIVYVGRDSNDEIISHSYPDDDESVPFYPSRRYGIHDLYHVYNDCTFVPMNIAEWVERYLSRMIVDEVFVELFPVPGETAKLYAPDDILSDIQNVRQVLSQWHGE